MLVTYATETRTSINRNVYDCDGSLSAVEIVLMIIVKRTVTIGIEEELLGEPNDWHGNRRNASCHREAFHLQFLVKINSKSMPFYRHSITRDILFL